MSTSTTHSVISHSRIRIRLDYQSAMARKTKKFEKPIIVDAEKGRSIVNGWNVAYVKKKKPISMQRDS
ncbi:hypothetical protein L1887_03070 [Cichorium endivia]|nr:hypothetical protein L1887_03070 [Cichorium endivia]